MSFSTVPEIDVQQLSDKLQSEGSFVLLDVREAWELDQAMIVDDRLKVMPMSRLAQLGEEALPEEVQQKDAEVLVMCHHGVRSVQVAQWLLTRGWMNVFSVRGGIAAYAQEIDGSVGRY
ncbi:MAG: rhodanese-like domain-containing protein [Anaerolineales bacterium]|jgi:rhodanese-related sulfurtransferase